MLLKVGDKEHFLFDYGHSDLMTFAGNLICRFYKRYCRDFEVLY